PPFVVCELVVADKTGRAVAEDVVPIGTKAQQHGRRKEKEGGDCPTRTGKAKPNPQADRSIESQAIPVRGCDFGDHQACGKLTGRQRISGLIIPSSKGRDWLAITRVRIL